jgi:LPXTG-motif cell wall-anchored protein
MRRRLGALIAASVVVLGVAGVLASSAGAQTPPPTTVFFCSYSVDPTTLPDTGGTVTVSGVAPGSSVVRIFTDGTLAATTTSAPVTGAFSATIFITASVEVSGALDGYPSTPCIGVGGETVERDGNANSTTLRVLGSTATRLPTTGANDTKPIVLVGVSALALGLVLVVAARRRAGVHGRD